MSISYIKMRWPQGLNYSYLLVDSLQNALLIDPAEPLEVLPFLKDVHLKYILNTHHHHDHSGGNEYFKRNYKDIIIIGGANSPLVDKIVTNNQLSLLKDFHIESIHTPCHTQDSICYYVTHNGEKSLFTGDTLFNCGCGRFFEGDAKQMYDSLKLLVDKVSPETKVYPGHEYTKSNVEFAQSVLPLNKELQQLHNFISKNQVSTGVFTIADELSYNPFLRLDDPELKLKSTDILNRMDELRTLKNNF